MCRNRKLLDPGHYNGSSRLPGSLRDFIAVEKCQTQDIQSEAGDSQASLRTVWSGKMADPGGTQPTHGHSNRPGTFISILHCLGSCRLTPSLFLCTHLPPQKIH